MGKLQGQRKIMGGIQISAQTTLSPGLVSVESQPEGKGCLKGDHEQQGMRIPQPGFEFCSAVESLGALQRTI